MSELFALICKKEALEPSCHQLSLPSVGNRKLTFDSETAVGSLKIREVSIVHVGAALDPSTGDTQWAQVDVMDLVDDEAEEVRNPQNSEPAKFKKYILPTFNKKCISEVVRIGSVIFDLSKLSKTKFLILCDVIFLVRLLGKFKLITLGT